MHSALVQGKQEPITRDVIKEYFLKKPEVVQVGPDELRIGKGGRGRIEILELTDRYFKEGSLFRITIYGDCSQEAAEPYDHIHQAIEWCLGADAYSAFRQLFDPELGILTEVPHSEQDLDRLYALAAVYFSILDDEGCTYLESRLRDLTSELRKRVGQHVNVLR